MSAIDPNLIHVKKFKNEDAVLAQMESGVSIRDAALICGVSSKTAHKIRLKYADKFPKKEKVWVTPKLPRKKTIKRTVYIPADVDEKICMAARKESRKWTDQANLIFDNWRIQEELKLL